MKYRMLRKVHRWYGTARFELWLRWINFRRWMIMTITGGW